MKTDRRCSQQFLIGKLLQRISRKSMVKIGKILTQDQFDAVCASLINGEFNYIIGLGGLPSLMAALIRLCSQRALFQDQIDNDQTVDAISTRGRNLAPALASYSILDQLYWHLRVLVKTAAFASVRLLRAEVCFRALLKCTKKNYKVDQMRNNVH